MIRRMYELGRNIAVYRKKAGITQAQLAQMLTKITEQTVSLCMVSNWQRAIVDVPAAIMPDICHCLHCSSFDLYPHSESLTDRDIRLMETIRAMSESDKNDLYYLLHEWRGDRTALLKLDVIHAMQDESLRYEADKNIIESYLYASKHQPQLIDHRAHADLNYVRKAHKHLLDDQED